ncbi:MAG: erythromycin esterase family protein [Phenylobacterium sp.]|uniref:erythromycin esterase family protein n=1 Tax=Phenylobacterium sp. TaxID=1871053 RepID=UPI0025EF194E|nr:erythromycin esterase family protein [Phenylobacterium sp.]MBI1196883.1 erythromycin esterase family protein [Phenylobacterium sp.]
MPDIRPRIDEDRHLPPGAAGHIAACAEPLPDFEDPRFGRLFDRFGDARVVLLGASNHGAAEFCRARAAITRWLVEKRGFNIVALEADASDTAVLDARAYGERPPGAAFAGFPSWVWRNREFDAFVDWLADHNRGRGSAARTSLHGLDRYDLSAAMAAALDHLRRVDPDAAAIARERYGCLRPWALDPEAFGRMPVSGRYAACETAVTAMLGEALARRLRETEDASEAAANARLLRGADDHYRAMYYGGADAWNRRSQHLFETLDGLIEARGGEAKAVVWAHNAQVGDARAVEMGHVRDEISLGQLCREAWGEDARLIGFGAHAGRLACAADWDAPLEIKALEPSLPESLERQSHNAGVGRFLLDLQPGVHGALRRALTDPRLERFIGAVYRPQSERWSHYAECRLAEQFDAWVWFDETTPVTPL